ncbi:DUF3667 domain-containing protein [Sphingomonas sp.]|uniref:DUF3667 domain-containing protein n=1 Tax=Sphingomonas sp. TaxID=28214 RepID=UPI003B3A88D2
MTGDGAQREAWREEIERARTGAPAIGHADAEPCANCGTIRVGPYCQTCGQSGHVHRDLHTLLHDLAHGVFHFEGKIWRTLPLLVRRPGELTRRYIEGERVKFVSPMALFLFTVFLMFAVVSNLAGGGKSEIGTAIRTGAELAEARTTLATLEAQRAGTRSAVQQATLDRRIAEAKREVAAIDRAMETGAIRAVPAHASRPATVQVDLGWRWLNEAVAHAAANPDLLLYKMKSNGYKFSWALIPISLPFIWLLFAFRRDVGLYDHAIFAIYSLAFMSLGVVSLVVLSRIGVPTGLLAIAALTIPPLHMYKHLRGTYRLGRFGAGWRTFALLLIVTISTTLFLSLLFYMGSE